MLAVCVGLPPVILEVAGDGYVPLLCGVVLHAIRSNTSAMKYQRVFMFGGVCGRQWIRTVGTRPWRTFWRGCSG